MALYHGGDLAGAEARFGRPAAGWLDLSTGINPHPYPLPAIDEASWRRLPDAALMQPLFDAARRFYGVSADAGLVAAPGTQALIQWLPRLLSPGRVDVLGPTYGEHARCWALAGHTVATVDGLPAPAAAEGRVVVVVRPNNPDGRVIDLAALEALAGRARLLVIDEAFAEVLDQPSAVPLAARPGVAVLRSFGKFFGLPGLRLGFAIAAPPLAADLSAALGPWAVAGPAAEVGTAALSDTAWAAAARRRLGEDARRLDSMLADAGLTVVGGTDLFRLVRTPAAEALHAHLAAQGILVRPFPGLADWLRFGLPGLEREFARVAKAFAEFGGVQP